MKVKKKSSSASKPATSSGQRRRRGAPIERATMSVEEAGGYIGISRQTAYAAAREGLLPVIRMGRRVLVVRARLDQMLADGTLGMVSSQHPWDNSAKRKPNQGIRSTR